MKDFFIDTADVNYIRELWSKIKDKVEPSNVRGITTNPNAFFKIGKLSLAEWLDTIPELCKLVTEIRGDDKGVVYVQGPSSKMDASENEFYLNMVKHKTDGKTRIGLKIPPRKDLLVKLCTMRMGLEHINVTGVADAGTALKCMTWSGLRYVSIIPGRMEEAGIDAKAHLAYVAQSGSNFNIHGHNVGTEVIAGSMRTIEGLIMTFQHGTVPTIGERVWNQLLEGDAMKFITDIDYTQPLAEELFCPVVNEVNTKLSTDFFEQMDKCGEQAYKDLKIGHRFLKDYFNYNV